MRRLSILTILSNAGEDTKEFLERLREFLQDLENGQMVAHDAIVAYAQQVEEVENRYAVRYLVVAEQVAALEDACLRAGLDFLPATEELTEDEAQLYDWVYVDSEAEQKRS